MSRRPPRATRPDTLLPYTTLFRSDNPIFFAHHAGILGSDACAGRLVRRSAVSSVAGEADFARTDVRAGAVVDADFATRCDGRPSLCCLWRDRDAVET